MCVHTHTHTTHTDWGLLATQRTVNETAYKAGIRHPTSFCYTIFHPVHIALTVENNCMRFCTKEFDSTFTPYPLSITCIYTKSLHTDYRSLEIFHCYKNFHVDETTKSIKRIFLKDKISSRIIPLLSKCSSASILDTASDKSLTTTPSLTTTAAYQSHSLYGTRTHDMHLLSNFRISNGRIKIVTTKATLLL